MQPAIDVAVAAGPRSNARAGLPQAPRGGAANGVAAPRPPRSPRAARSGNAASIRHPQRQSAPQRRPAPTRDVSADPLSAAQRIIEELTRRITPNRYRMWFSQARLEVDGLSLRVLTVNAFAARWIEGNFAATLRSVAEDTLGHAVTIDIRVAPEAAAVEARSGPQSQESSRAGPQAAPARGRGHDGSDDQGNRAAPSNGEAHALITNGEAHAPVSPPAARGPRLHRLEDFVVGASNRLAHTAACRLAESDDVHGLSPLFIHGECGVGKTHLLQGICRRFMERSGTTGGMAGVGGGAASRVRYVTGEQFTNEFIAALRSNSIDAFRLRIRRLALLAIDDVHFLANKIKTQSEFQCTLDAIDFGGARVVLASDNHPHHIRRFSQSLVSRFVSGMVVRVERPDRELRCALVRRLAERRGLRLTDAAVEQLASQAGNTVRELEGAMTRLAAWHSVMNVESNGAASDGASQNHDIGLVLVEQVLREDRARPSHIVRIASVIEAVCQRLGVGKADLVGSSRHRRVVVARGMVAHLGRELTTLSYPEIAQALGRENHSTVHTADQRMRGQLQKDERLDFGGNEPASSLRELADLLRRDICRAPA